MNKKPSQPVSIHFASADLHANLTKIVGVTSHLALHPRLLRMLTFPDKNTRFRIVIKFLCRLLINAAIHKVFVGNFYRRRGLKRVKVKARLARSALATNGDNIVLV